MPDRTNHFLSRTLQGINFFLSHVRHTGPSAQNLFVTPLTVYSLVTATSLVIKYKYGQAMHGGVLKQPKKMLRITGFFSSSLSSCTSFFLTFCLPLPLVCFPLHLVQGLH